MPTNKYGDNYEENQYNGDASYGGRVKTNKQSSIEAGQAWMEDMFVNEVLPTLFPELQSPTESFSTRLEQGEYKIDSDTDSEGYSTIMCEVAVSPERYAQMEQNGWQELLNEFSKAAQSFESNVYSNDDNPGVPTITFEITVR